MVINSVEAETVSPATILAVISSSMFSRGSQAITILVYTSRFIQTSHSVNISSCFLSSDTTVLW